jgi:endonuclease-3
MVAVARTRQRKVLADRCPGMGTPLESRDAQVTEVLDRLYEVYPEPDISLDFSNRLELLVAVVLSAQCTDERVNEVTAELFEKYRTPEDYAGADEEELAEDIYGITYHNSKAGYLTSAGETIVEEHDGEVPATMSELTDLAGVGRKTANVVLQHGHEVVEGIVVDTHVQRLSRRLGLTEETTPEKMETDLMGIVPEDDWKEYTHLLISHGRETCTARNPDCEDCVLEDLCPSSKLDSDVDLADGSEW